MSIENSYIGLLFKRSNVGDNIGEPICRSIYIVTYVHLFPVLTFYFNDVA